MRVRACERNVVPVKPFHLGKFLRVEMKLLLRRALHDIPQRDVRVTRGEPNCRRAGDHQWLADLIFRINAQLLSQFAPDRVSRMFARFNMTSGRQPELRRAMIDEENVIVSDDGEV